ncbi:MAG TPA: hypothetical protein VH420_03840 [Gaiellaceae bacterium]
MALTMIVGILAVLTVAGTSVMVYTSENVRNAGRSANDGDAYSLAEAGMSYALSVLENASDPKVSTLLPGTTVNLGNGTATYSGTINASYVWTLTSVGSIPNPAGAPIKRTLHRTVNVVGLNSGADGASWSRFYQDSTSSCLTIDSNTFVTNVATRGDLCLRNGGAITGANTTVDVGGNVSIIGPDTTTTKSAGSGAGWTSSGNIVSSNNSDASTSIAGAATSANLDGTNFSMGIPSTAIVRGVSARIERASSVGNALKDADVRLLKNGSPAGNDKAVTSSYWPTSDTYRTYGSGSDLWGTTWTASDINASNFGLRLTATNTGIFSSSNIQDPATGTGSTWTSPGNVLTNNSSYATKSLSAGVSSGTLDATSYSMALPAGATVTGIQARIDRKTSVSSTIRDFTVQLLKAGSAVGNNKAATGTNWGTSDAYATYGADGDLWGTTWTQSDVNASNFGLRLVAKNNSGSSSATASIDHMELTVYYDYYQTSTATVDHAEITVTHTADTNGIGTSGTNIQEANIGGTCTYNGGGAHDPCTSADHVYSTAINKVAAAANPALTMPSVDFNYWWANAKPGPKHFCTNPNPGISTSFFDNDAGSTSVSNHSLPGNGEMTPTNSDYTCQVVENGTLVGELSWNHTTHVMTILGTVFIDGDFRFDDDGQVVHYQGRATLMSGGHDEIDEVVCAGGSGTTLATSCLSDMSNWDLSQNYMVLMSKEDNEYDQGGTSCGGSPPSCYGGYLPAGFQGVMYSTAECAIHQNFQDSGPVICNTIDLPEESGDNPTFYTFPFTGNLTDGQKYANTATATSFELDVGPQDG